MVASTAAICASSSVGIGVLLVLSLSHATGGITAGVVQATISSSVRGRQRRRPVLILAQVLGFASRGAVVWLTTPPGLLVERHGVGFGRFSLGSPPDTVGLRLWAAARVDFHGRFN
jgi:hypothetical protein